MGKERIKERMKKDLKELYDDFNVPINNNGGYIEMGGFTICLLIFLLSFYLFDKFDILNWIAYYIF